MQFFTQLIFRGVGFCQSTVEISKVMFFQPLVYFPLYCCQCFKWYFASLQRRLLTNTKQQKQKAAEVLCMIYSMFEKKKKILCSHIILWELFLLAIAFWYGFNDSGLNPLPLWKDECVLYEKSVGNGNALPAVKQ